MNDDYILPAHEFKGQELHAWCEATRVLYLNIFEESNITFSCYSLIYLLAEYAKDKKGTIKTVFNKDKFRENVMEWISEFTEDDRKTASELAALILDDGERGKVETDSGETPQGGG